MGENLIQRIITCNTSWEWRSISLIALTTPLHSLYFKTNTPWWVQWEQPTLLIVPRPLVLHASFQLQLYSGTSSPAGASLVLHLYYRLLSAVILSDFAREAESSIGKVMLKCYRVTERPSAAWLSWASLTVRNRHEIDVRRTDTCSEARNKLGKWKTPLNKAEQWS